MDKTQTMLIIITALVAVTAVCSVYSAVMQHDNGSMSDAEIDEIKDKVAEANKYGGRIYYNGSHIEKNSTITFTTDDSCVIIKSSTSSYYIPFSSVSMVSVSNH